MRSDTKRLLDRLGQPDFSYREYDDTPTTSTDRWPLFEVISRRMQSGLGHPLEEALPEADLIAPTEGKGNDIQSLIARIARGRAA